MPAANIANIIGPNGHGVMIKTATGHNGDSQNGDKTTGKVNKHFTLMWA